MHTVHIICLMSSYGPQSHIYLLYVPIGESGIKLLNNIHYHLQYGFRSRVSCETQLNQFTHDLVTNMQSDAKTDVIVMDFSKAFDKVRHTKIIHKHHYGI